MNRTLILAGFLLLVSCSGKNNKTLQEEENYDRLIYATLWYQKSAEMRALYYQCYNNAETALMQNLATAGKGAKNAVVMDIDETILDNSPFEAWQVIENKSFNGEDWSRWVMEAKALPLPGAVSFTRFADSLGVEVFYVSNRKSSETDITLENMKNMGFAFADSTHMLLKESTSSKTERRQKVAETHNIILLVGDNLADLNDIFEDRPVDYGMADVDSVKNYFGTKYIILPNPMYGNWLSEILHKSEGKTSREKLINQLVSF